VYEICAKTFLEGTFIALQFVSCALVSRLVCAPTHAQLRGNIAKGQFVHSGSLPSARTCAFYTAACIRTLDLPQILLNRPYLLHADIFKD